MMSYEKLTLENAVNLAAPHTWAASILPILLGTELSIADDRTFHPVLFILMLTASVLLQSSVNTLNDYHDFIKGTDLMENSDDPNDAVLVFNNIDPSHVRILGFGFMAAAVACGIYPVICGGLITLIIGFIGCAVIVLYSAGNVPLSSLPVGEAVSGIVMGGLITCGVYSASIDASRDDSFAGTLLRVLFVLVLFSIPLIIGIALIMMTNNTCDIERDTGTGRRTWPVVLGRTRACIVYRMLSVLWVASIVALMMIFFRKGILVSLIFLVVSVPVLKKLLTAPLTPDRRGPCMSAIVKSNYCLGVAYLAGIAVFVAGGESISLI
jgi:1,4-dihydroxy-2-naphthoate octaprenyltransferase